MSKTITKKKFETKRTKEYLRVQLTREELLVNGKEQADKLTEKVRLEEDLDRIKADFKAKLSALDARINTLTSCVSTGYEYRNVPCTEYLGEPTPDKKRVVRDDTGEQIAVRDMTKEEMQRELLIEEGNPDE